MYAIKNIVTGELMLSADRDDIDRFNTPEDAAAELNYMAKTAAPWWINEHIIVEIQETEQ